MRCPNCRCEIGNLTTCPYCGVMLYRRTAPTATSRRPPTAVPTERITPEPRDRRRERHLANLDMWGLLCTIFLGGIFVLELLQLLAILR